MNRLEQLVVFCHVCISFTCCFTNYTSPLLSRNCLEDMRRINNSKTATFPIPLDPAWRSVVSALNDSKRKRMNKDDALPPLECKPGLRSRCLMNSIAQYSRRTSQRQPRRSFAIDLSACRRRRFVDRLRRRYSCSYGWQCYT